eukprot:scaffold2230_cov187-Amphora_coffeaeformis.AAC.4
MDPKKGHANHYGVFVGKRGHHHHHFGIVRSPRNGGGVSKRNHLDARDRRIFYLVEQTQRKRKTSQKRSWTAQPYPVTLVSHVSKPWLVILNLRTRVPWRANTDSRPDEAVSPAERAVPVQPPRSVPPLL